MAAGRTCPLQCAAAIVYLSSTTMRTFPCLESTPGNYTVLWLKIAMQYCIASIGNQLQCWASTTQSLGHLAGISPIAALFISSIVSASSFAFAPSPLKPNLLSPNLHQRLIAPANVLDVLVAGTKDTRKSIVWLKAMKIDVFKI